MYTLNIPVEDTEQFIEDLAIRENLDQLLDETNEIINEEVEEETCQY